MSNLKFSNFNLQMQKWHQEQIQSLSLKYMAKVLDLPKNLVEQHLDHHLKAFKLNKYYRVFDTNTDTFLDHKFKKPFTKGDIVKNQNHQIKIKTQSQVQAWYDFNH